MRSRCFGGYGTKRRRHEQSALPLRTSGITDNAGASLFVGGTVSQSVTATRCPVSRTPSAMQPPTQPSTRLSGLSPTATPTPRRRRWSSPVATRWRSPVPPSRQLTTLRHVHEALMHASHSETAKPRLGVVPNRSRLAVPPDLGGRRWRRPRASNERRACPVCAGHDSG